MAVEKDPAGWLPEPPPPRPARRDAAIGAALRRFDGVDEPVPVFNQSPQRSWTQRHRPQLGVAMTAALLVVIGIPAALIGIRDPNPDTEAAPPPASARNETSVVQPANEQLELPAPASAEASDRSAPREAALAKVATRRSADAAVVKERPAEGFAPSPFVAVAPPPPPSPSPRSAERSADVAQESGEIITTGSLIRNPNLRSEQKSAAARAPSADAAKPPYPAFLSRLQTAVRANHRAAIIGLVDFPLRVNFRTAPRTYRDARSVERDFDRIFTLRVRRAILNQQPDRLFTNYQGAMVGEGEVWFDQRCAKAACSAADPVRIVAINP